MEEEKKLTIYTEPRSQQQKRNTIQRKAFIYPCDKKGERGKNLPQNGSPQKHLQWEQCPTLESIFFNSVVSVYKKKDNKVIK